MRERRNRPSSGSLPNLRRSSGSSRWACLGTATRAAWSRLQTYDVTNEGCTPQSVSPAGRPEGLAEPRSPSGCDGRSEARTQGVPVVDNYRGDRGRRLGADSAARRHRLGFVKPSSLERQAPGVERARVELTAELFERALGVGAEDVLDDADLGVVVERQVDV